MGDELLSKEERHAKAAQKYDWFAVMPSHKPFYLDPTIKEPIDSANKKFLSPVFLVDPIFTED